MADKPEFVQLENSDDANSVRDRLSFMRGQQVLLIWPERGTVLTRKLDLVLIQREAMRRAIRLALVTHDPQVIKHADELNISTFETIGAAQRSRWKRGRSKVFTDRDDRPKDAPEPEELAEVASRVRSDEESPAVRARRRILRLVLMLILVGVVLGVAYVIMPGATVVITPARETRTVEVRILASAFAPTVDVENATIPATRLQIEIEETGALNATGLQQLDNVPARGTVVFINQTNRVIEIPINTNVATTGGTPILFRTTEPARLSAGVGAEAEVGVEALPSSAGSASNVAAGQINTVIGDLAADLTVRNLNPTSGGEDRVLPAVTQADRDRLLAIIRQQIQERAYSEMLPRLTDTQFIVIETLRIVEERGDWTRFSADVGQVTDTLTLTMRAIVEASYIDLRFGQQIVLAQLAAGVPRGRAILPDTVFYEMGRVENVTPDGQITFIMNGSGEVIAQIDSAVVREQLAGRSLQDAQIYLLTEISTNPDVPPTITISPEWLGQMPILPMRIEVRIEGGT